MNGKLSWKGAASPVSMGNMNTAGCCILLLLNISKAGGTAVQLQLQRLQRSASGGVWQRVCLAPGWHPVLPGATLCRQCCQGVTQAALLKAQNCVTQVCAQAYTPAQRVPSMHCKGITPALQLNT